MIRGQVQSLAERMERASQQQADFKSPSPAPSPQQTGAASRSSGVMINSAPIPTASCALAYAVMGQGRVNNTQQVRLLPKNTLCVIH